MSKKSPVAKKARAERLRHRGSSTAAHVRDLERRHAELDRLSAAGAFDAPADRDLEPGEAQVMCYMTLEHKVWLVIVILNGEVRILPVEKYTGPDDLCTKVAEYIRRKGGTKMELVEQLSPWHDDEITEDVYREFCQCIEENGKEQGAVVTHTWGSPLEDWN